MNKEEKENVVRLAIIDHETHQLHIEDAPQHLIDEFGGEQEYIDNIYQFKGSYSWDYIVSADYLPEDPSLDSIDIDFNKLTD